MRTAVAVLLAFATASLYALSTSLQAVEARHTSRDSALSASLIGKLLRRPLWLAGSAAGLVAWPMQAVALSLGSVALVQPALGFGLVVLLILGVTVLHESVGLLEGVGVLAVAAAVAVLGWAAPRDTGHYTVSGHWAVAGLLIASAAAPHVLRLLHAAGGLPTSITAGVGWAAVGLGTSILDIAIGNRHWLVALAWGAAIAVAAWSTLIAEMTSLQTWPATRAIPVAFGLEMLLPAVLLPALARLSPPHPVAFVAALALACGAAVILGRSGAVAKAVTG